MSDNKAEVHSSTGTYLAVFAILTVVTIVEVAVFYIPALSGVLAPMLLVLSACKFALVVMFYMHLKGDPKLFTWVFVGPLMIAGAVLVALLALFGVWQNAGAA